MEYVRRLVDLRYIGADAIEVVQSKRDPPTHGIGLQSIGRGRGRGGGAGYRYRPRKGDNVTRSGLRVNVWSRATCIISSQLIYYSKIKDENVGYRSFATQANFPSHTDPIAMTYSVKTSYS
jgi:hypothetical protein